MHLTFADIVCCPPPLFHCFGLVMGFLNTLSHGASIVFPSDAFDASLTLDAIAAERCTALLGVPTMFIAQLEKLAMKPYKITSLRVGLASGAPVPIALQERLSRDMGIEDVLIAYGMTEVSPVSTMMDISDPKERKRGGLGKPMPHNTVKIVDHEGKIVPRGTRGEICSSGYALMREYLDNPEATDQAMRKDEKGVLWMHTGDEGYVDGDGYAHITGRIKDMIIRGQYCDASTFAIFFLIQPQAARTSSPLRSKNVSCSTRPLRKSASSVCQMTDMVRSSAHSFALAMAPGNRVVRRSRNGLVTRWVDTRCQSMCFGSASRELGTTFQKQGVGSIRSIF
jgi:non-ribosomal peptide synthetase component E (peptide arylation enzyme)